MKSPSSSSSAFGGRSVGRHEETQKMEKSEKMSISLACLQLSATISFRESATICIEWENVPPNHPPTGQFRTKCLRLFWPLLFFFSASYCFYFPPPLFPIRISDLFCFISVFSYSWLAMGTRHREKERCVKWEGERTHKEVIVSTTNRGLWLSRVLSASLFAFIHTYIIITSLACIRV